MTSFIKKKTSDKKFYGYTGPVKPETKSNYIQKKSDKKFENNTSYGYSGKPAEVKKRKQKGDRRKEPTTWITKKKK